MLYSSGRISNTAEFPKSRIGIFFRQSECQANFTPIYVLAPKETRVLHLISLSGNIIWFLLKEKCLKIDFWKNITKYLGFRRQRTEKFILSLLKLCITRTLPKHPRAAILNRCHKVVFSYFNISFSIHHLIKHITTQYNNKATSSEDNFFLF